MNINDNIPVGTRETGECVLVHRWTTPQFSDDDEWNVLVKWHVEDTVNAQSIRIPNGHHPDLVRMCVYTSVVEIMRDC